jgi:hypothetical protein
MGEVRLDAGKAPRFGPAARPTAGYDALLDTQHAISRCPSRSDARSWPGNRWNPGNVGLNTLATITDKKAGFRSLSDTWADTTTPHGRLMLTVLGVLAEFERDLIRARTSEGRERAKARGVKLGRKPKPTDHQKREAIRRRDREPVRDIARSYNVSHSTISRLAPSRR